MAATETVAAMQASDSESGPSCPPAHPPPPKMVLDQAGRLRNHEQIHRVTSHRTLPPYRATPHIGPPHTQRSQVPNRQSATQAALEPHRQRPPAWCHRVRHRRVHRPDATGPQKSAA